MPRLYRPQIARLVKAELALVDEYDEGIAYFLQDDKELMTRYEAEATVPETQITYSFSSASRPNRFAVVGVMSRAKTASYGRGGMSYRLLYELLCKYYNGGEYFIDTYLTEVFPHRAVYREYRAIHKRITSAIQDEVSATLEATPKKKDGTPNYSTRGGRRLKEFSVWKDEIVKSKSLALAADIRQDIIVCLSTSRIRLAQRYVSKATQDKRAKLVGVDRKRFFYASGQLIRALRIFIDLSDGRGAAWQDYQ